MPREEWADWVIYLRDKCICRYCGMCGIEDFHRWRHLTIDHVMPLDHGGSDGAENKVVCCSRCNVLLGGEKPQGATREAQVAWKRQKAAAKCAADLVDYQEMMRELLPAIWS